jgi:hypothetical protein
LFIQKSIKNEKAEKKRNSGKRAEKREKSGNFPQKAEEVATLFRTHMMGKSLVILFLSPSDPRNSGPGSAGL